MKNFLEIPDTQGNYLINRSGETYSLKTNRSLKCSKGNSGYEQVVLRVNGQSETHSIHRLVAKTFLPNPHSLRVVNHLNGNKLDNRVENLEWCTHSENSVHANRAGLTPAPPRWAAGKFGAAHNRSKTVYAYRADGSLLGEFGSGNEAARMTGTKEPAVAKALQGGGFSRGQKLLFSHKELTPEEVLAAGETVAGLYKARGAKLKRPVKALNANGETVGTYPGAVDAAAAHGLFGHNVMDCLRFQRTNLKTGLRFEYA